MKLFRRLIETVVMGLVVLPALAENHVIEVYKSPYCGCCKHWVTHLEDNGFKVLSHISDNMSQIKLELGITNNLASCHTGKIGNYWIEGHVPAKDIKALLASNNKGIKGLTVPGMPAGQNVPGMETRPGNDTFDVLAVSNDGIKVFSHYE